MSQSTGASSSTSLVLSQLPEDTIRAFVERIYPDGTTQKNEIKQKLPQLTDIQKRCLADICNILSEKSADKSKEILSQSFSIIYQDINDVEKIHQVLNKLKTTSISVDLELLSAICVYAYADKKNNVMSPNNVPGAIAKMVEVCNHLINAKIFKKENFMIIQYRLFSIGIIVDALVMLTALGQLNQDNFDKILRPENTFKYANSIIRVLRELHFAEILNGNCIDAICNRAQYADKIAAVFSYLRSVNLLNQSTVDKTCEHANFAGDIANLLATLIQKGIPIKDYLDEIFDHQNTASECAQTIIDKHNAKTSVENAKTTSSTSTSSSASSCSGLPTSSSAPAAPVISNSPNSHWGNKEKPATPTNASQGCTLL